MTTVQTSITRADPNPARDPSSAHDEGKRKPILVLAAGLFVWVFIAAVVALMARNEWNNMVANIQSTATTVSRLLAENSDRLLISADLVRHQAGRIVGAAGPFDIDRAMHDDLRRLIDISPNIVSVWVGDAQGQAVLTTREFPAPDLTAADREYFTAVRDDPDRLFVGNLLDNRYPAEALLINTSRRLSDPNGDMRGFVQVSLDPAPISKTFQQVDIGFDAALWWIGPDDRPLIREPALSLAQLDDQTPLEYKSWPDHDPEGGDGDAVQTRTPFLGVSGVDGQPRLYFWSDAPLYGSRIIVGVSYDAMVARWMARMASTAGLGMVIGLASMLILLLLHRARTRSLAYAAQLEGDVRERTRELDRAVKQKDLILQELEHRVRNAFSTILALTRQMLRSSDTLEDFHRDFPRRLMALSRTHLLLVGAEDRERAMLHELANAALEPYQIEQAKFTISGPSIELSPSCSFGVGIILHELVTNAVKYGSLTSAGGSLSVQWDADADGIHLVWRETGGSAIHVPKGHGSGTEIIERAVELIGGSIDRKFEPDGVRVHLHIPPDSAR